MDAISLAGGLNPLSLASDLLGSGTSSSDPLSQALNVIQTLAQGLTGENSGSSSLTLPTGVSMPSGGSLQSNGALQQFAQQDPAGAQSFMQCFAPGGGGGNAAAKLLADDVRSGSVDKNTAKEVAAMIQPLASANGFGTVNLGADMNLSQALGDKI